MESFFTLLSFGDSGFGDELARGVLVTLLLALTTVPFGLVLGFIVALAKHSERKFLRVLGNGYTTLFRGLPELLTLFIIYYGVQTLVQDIADWLSNGEGGYIEINSFFAGVVALGFVFSSYASEVFLAAIKEVKIGQIEAGSSLGLTRYQVFRTVIFPQLWRYALPGIGNIWMVLLKDTALVSAIGLTDILRITQIAVGSTKMAFEFYTLALLLYLVLSSLSGLMIERLEVWSKRGYEAR